jgi:hypothetical protein
MSLTKYKNMSSLSTATAGVARFSNRTIAEEMRGAGTKALAGTLHT